jgi:hypothetical protein
MKKAILYLLLFTYSTIMLKPAMPYVSDAVAHILWYNEHMATVHFEHGKYHAHKESIEASKKETPGSNEETGKKITTASEHCFAQSINDFFVPPVAKTTYFNYHSLLAGTKAWSESPPPKF